jgi:hypothetical protein
MRIFQKGDGASTFVGSLERIAQSVLIFHIGKKRQHFVFIMNALDLTLSS